MISVINLFVASNDVDIQYSHIRLFNLQLYSLLNEDYVLELETFDTKPFCERLLKKGGEWCWSIACFGKKAYQSIILPLTDRNFNSFILPETNKAQITITRKSVFKQSVKSMVEESLLSDVPYRFTVHFITPTVFRDNDRPVFFPDVYLMYQSLLNKSQPVSDKISFADKETFEELVKATSITDYDIKTTGCILNNERAKGFVGRVSFRIDGPELMRGFTKMLFTLGEFTGVGEGCMLGLGTMCLDKGERKHE